MHEDGETVETPGPPPGPGYRLREARERRGLAIADVARSLRLDPKVISALEADDYAALPAPIFVRGYLTQYCKLLGLPGDECLAEYERTIGGNAPPPLVVRRSAGDEITPGASPVALVSGLVGAAVLVLLVLWWVARPVDDPAPAAADTPRIQTPPPRAFESVAPTPRADDVGGGEAETVDDNQIDATEVDAVDEAGPTPAPVEPEPALTRVRFEFREESWAEIVDANNRRLFFDLARAGAVVDVRGVPPISVFLGNAPAARITVDGRAFDQTRYVRSGNVARFTLGGDLPQADRR